MQTRVRGTASVAAALLIEAVLSTSGAGCERGLSGARCPCAAGWVCCLPQQNVCMAQRAACPAVPASGAGGAITSGGAGGTDTSGAAGGAGGTDGGAGDALPDAGSVDIAVALSMPEICTGDGWCWTHPLPTAETMVAAWAAAPDDVWIIGEAGTILRWNGALWTVVPAPSPSLLALWGAAPDDVWLGGDDGLWHWDGHAFSEVPPNASPGSRGVAAIWGSAADDVWAVGAWMRHWDGHAWATFNDLALIGPFHAVWGSGKNDVYAGVLGLAATDQHLLHWNGIGWSQVATFGGDHIAGTGAGDVLVSSANQMHRWDGTAWTAPATDLPLVLFNAGPRLVGALDEALTLSWWDGARWAPAFAPDVPAPTRFGSLWADSASNVWGVGPGGAVAHWDARAWAPLLPAPPISGDAIEHLAGSGGRDVWAAAGGSLLHNDGTRWTIALSADRVGGDIRDIWASGPDDLWLLGGDNLLHRWNGSAWSTVDVPLRGASSAEMKAIAGVSASDVWIVRGSNTLLHWNGADWTGTNVDRTSLSDVWVAGPDDVWAAGDRLSHLTAGTIFTPTLPITAPVTAVAGSAPDDGWALAGPSTLHYDGHGWTVVRTADHDFVAVAAGARDDVWLIGDTRTPRSAIHHWDGSTWTMALAPLTLHDVWRGPDGATWVGGDRGALLRHR